MDVTGFEPLTPIQSPVFVNRELVDKGYAVWREGLLANET